MWSRAARTPAGFEEFYKEVRSRLLLQTYALTGDAQAAERAVRDALVVAWHHWRKVSRLESPEDWVRPLAWTRAVRRSQARWWSRQKGIDDDAKATLDALGNLTTQQRKVLLLTVLTTQPLDGIAREVGVTRAAAERELQTAMSRFALALDLPSTAIRARLEALAPGLAEVRWPRPSIVMRAGSARRRVHTTLGAAAAVAAVAVTGSLVTDLSGARPALATKGILHGEQRHSPAAHPRASKAPPAADPLTPESLLGTTQVQGALAGQWQQGKTSRNTDGDGLVFTCQAGRYADPAGIGALVRTFSGTSPQGAALTAGQSAEASASVSAARKAYRTTLGWYAGCMSPRVQLVSTHQVLGVGDAAILLVLRRWSAPTSTQVVGVARTGALTTTLVTTRADAKGQPADGELAKTAGLLGAAVTGLCVLPDHGTCTTTTPDVQDASPVPVGGQPALLNDVDLPPVAGVDAPWAATDPRKATTNVAATRCDQADFSTPDVSHAVTRSYLIPTAAQLPAEFGLAETVGAMPEKRAASFVTTVRDRLAGCHEKDLGTAVKKVVDDSSKDADLTAWQLDIEISKTKTVQFLMAIIRNGTAVAQLTFVPSGDATISSDDFTALAERAQERLAALEPPG